MSAFDASASVLSSCAVFALAFAIRLLSPTLSLPSILKSSESNTVVPLLFVFVNRLRLLRDSEIIIGYCKTNLNDSKNTVLLEHKTLIFGFI